MINITYAALHMRAQTEKTTFSCKDDCRSILEWGKGLVKKSRLYPARAYTTLVVLVSSETYKQTNRHLALFRTGQIRAARDRSKQVRKGQDR